MLKFYLLSRGVKNQQETTKVKRKNFIKEKRVYFLLFIAKSQCSDFLVPLKINNKSQNRTIIKNASLVSHTEDVVSRFVRTGSTQKGKSSETPAVSAER